MILPAAIRRRVEWRRGYGPRWRALLVGLGISSLAVTLLVGTVELLLRVMPRILLPPGAYGVGTYSPELGMTVHGGPVIYNRSRYVVRQPNSDGFLDVDHSQGKPPGAMRVGFFGDSYVESEQVELPEVFFRRLPSTVGGHSLEAFGFGKSGWGAAQELIVWRTFGPRYELDVTCYVFVENDPGDSSLRLQRGRGWSPLPAADLIDSAPGFDIRSLSAPGELTGGIRLAKAIQARSLLARVVLTRLELLRQRGVRILPDPAAGSMKERAQSLPDPNALPSTWPPQHLGHVKELNERILARWRDEVQKQGGHFFILYVPRSEEQLTGKLPLADTWRPWLGAVTQTLGIPLLDPSAALSRSIESGDRVIDDHFSPAGHRVIAEVLGRYLASLAERHPAGHSSHVP